MEPPPPEFRTFTFSHTKWSNVPFARRFHAEADVRISGHGVVGARRALYFSRIAHAFAFRNGRSGAPSRGVPKDEQQAGVRGERDSNPET